MMGDWQSHDIQSDGQTADWDGRAPYLTAHGGLGYMWDVTDNVTADVYAKYFWGAPVGRRRHDLRAEV